MADPQDHGNTDIKKWQAREFKRKRIEKGKWEELFLQTKLSTQCDMLSGGMDLVISPYLL